MIETVVYLYRGKPTWLVSLRGIPEDEDLESRSPADPMTAVPPPFPRDMDVEKALRATRELYPNHDVRMFAWHRPKRDI